MKFCCYRKDPSNSKKYAGHWTDYNEDACCGEIATCNIGNVSLCATHFDLWVSTYGDPVKRGF